MTLALATRWFPQGTSLSQAADRVRGLGLDRLAYTLPGPVSGGAREDLRARGVHAVATLLSGNPGAGAEDRARFEARLTRASNLASRLKSDLVVVEGGDLAGRVAAALEAEDALLRLAARRGEVGDPSKVVALRQPHVAAAAEHAARTLHGPLREGVPLAIRPGGRASDLLGFEETRWLLDALPGLALAFDPARADRLRRLGLGPPAPAWAERDLGRVALVFVHGLGEDLEGGRHPEDVGCDWATLHTVLPRRGERALDLGPAVPSSEVEDAIRLLRAQREG